MDPLWRQAQSLIGEVAQWAQAYRRMQSDRRAFEFTTRISEPLMTAFDVASLTLIYGGNGGSIDIYAYESGGAVLDSFHQDHTEDGYPAGPITLSGNNIRKLSWADLDLYWGTYAPLDNVEVTSSNGAVPELPPVCLAALGLLPLGLKLRRRK